MRRLTTIEFIEKARKIHEDKYDYSKVEYMNAITKVCIICPEHGEFWQTPNTHLNGSGCKKCDNKKKATTIEKFIEKARSVHGDKYDYSKVKYNNNKDKVCVICPEHGEFWQTPNTHLKGNGCPKCGLLINAEHHKDDTDSFIKKAKLIHSNKYDYSKVNYVDSYTEVCIICPEHGEFWQKPNGHLSGSGCYKCVGRNKTTEEFIEQARKVHGDKYDYSKVNYIKSNEKVCVICPKHGEFWKTPNSHLRGSGCKECDNERKRELKYNTDAIIEKFKKVHNDRYIYSKYVYNGITEKSIIICPKHGEFLMDAHSHLKGNGCPKCNQSSLEDEICALLKDNGILYEQEKTFEWLKYKGKQFLDFYLPEYNIAIECQGAQHFKPIEFFSKGHKNAEKAFKERVKRDDNKRVLCLKNNVKLLYFSHKELFIENKSNIKNILSSKNEILNKILENDKKNT